MMASRLLHGGPVSVDLSNAGRIFANQANVNAMPFDLRYMAAIDYRLRQLMDMALRQMDTDMLVGAGATVGRPNRNSPLPGLLSIVQLPTATATAPFTPAQ